MKVQEVIVVTLTSVVILALASNLKFYAKVFYLMHKVLSDELSYTETGLGTAKIWQYFSIQHIKKN